MDQQRKTIQIVIEEFLSDVEMEEIAQKQAINVDDFCRLTGAAITGDMEKCEVIYTVSIEGVDCRPIDNHLLSMLSTDERREVVESVQHLSFPCTPAELISFLKATDWYFTLPDGFVEIVSGFPSPVENEEPKDRALRFYKMRTTGLSGREIAEHEASKGVNISVTQANNLCRKGARIKADLAKRSTTIAGQLDTDRVARKNSKTKAR